MYVLKYSKWMLSNNWIGIGFWKNWIGLLKLWLTSFLETNSRFLELSEIVFESTCEIIVWNSNMFLKELKSGFSND